MSLDFDRSPDGEPLPPAGQAPVPAQQAPASTDQERTTSASFTPKHAAGEPADDELADDEPTAADATSAPAGDPEPRARQPWSAVWEPGSAAHEPTAPGAVVPGSVVDEPETAELADDEPADDELADDEPLAAEPVLAEPAVADEPVANEPVADEGVPVAATASEATAYHSGVAPAWDTEAADDAAADRSAGIQPTADLDGPLLSDTHELRDSWQRIQVAFIDDPREAVADAAGLVDRMGQLLVGALRQRQEQLRAIWDRGGMPDGVDYADSGSPAGTVSADADRPTAGGGPDTEQLRLLIRRYRALFNELCRP